MTEIQTRTIDPRFGEKMVRVREFYSNDSDRGRDVQVHWTTYDVEQGSVIIKRANGEVFSLSIQHADQYARLRELSIKLSYKPGTDELHWELVAHCHPFYGMQRRESIDEAEAQAFIGRFVDLIEHYPSLILNNSGYTEHQPPRFRARGEDFVHLMDRLIAGAEFTAELIA